MKEGITKADWLTALACQSMAWRSMRSAPSAPDEADRFRMQQGQEIGALARKLYPDGVFVPSIPGQDAHKTAREFIACSPKNSFFEVTAFSPPFVAKADILCRHNGGWHVVEVKSGFSGEPEELGGLIADLAYTVMVFKRAGYSIGRASLMLLSRNYCFGDSPERLFEVVDTTAEVTAQVEKFETFAGQLAAVVFHDEPPTPALNPACRNCAFFVDECLGKGHEHTVLEIPSLSAKKLKRLSADNIVDLAGLPEDMELNDRQRRARDSAMTGQMIVHPALELALSMIAWPCHYLDFETVATTLPLYPGQGCHQQVLTQYSIHHCEHIHAEPSHDEYLADPFQDCQRELAEMLIVSLGSQGTILVYSSFEKTRIKALKAAYPDLASALEAILDRLVDLLSYVSDFVYHPEFRGSFSIKTVLPVLVPDLSYDGLAIRNGALAITRFARMARREITGPEIENTRQELMEYCKLDTLAMVRLHQELAKMISPQAAGAGRSLAS
jgi:CRISPR/Cas system-associated exonuclease Cas4 (RecB family)